MEALDKGAFGRAQREHLAVGGFTPGVVDEDGVAVKDFRAHAVAFDVNEAAAFGAQSLALHPVGPEWDLVRDVLVVDGACGAGRETDVAVVPSDVDVCRLAGVCGGGALSWSSLIGGHGASLRLVLERWLPFATYYVCACSSYTDVVTGCGLGCGLAAVGCEAWRASCGVGLVER